MGRHQPDINKINTFQTVFQKFRVASSKEHSSGDKITLVMFDNRAYSQSKYACSTAKYISSHLDFFFGGCLFVILF